MAQVVPYPTAHMEGYDVIGDIHGCATELTDLLDELGYRENDWTGAYWHRERQAVFVGDLIDRGSEQLRVLEIVSRMVDSGSAQIVMGNHEFNAIAYATERPDGSGEFLRRHSEKNTKQHHHFLEQIHVATRDKYLQWFKTFPLWLDLGGLRIIHACWHEPSMRIVENELGSNRFNSMDQFVRAATRGEPLHEAIEVLLNGPEISLDVYGQPPFHDGDGHARDSARVAWWRDYAQTLRQLALMDGNFTTADGRPYLELPDIEVGAQERSYFYRGDVPVLCGHYWRKGLPEQGRDWTARAACVDFSAGKGGDLLAYRWGGEAEIQADHYVRVGN
jgi:Calcineurin-like phosphoesterase